MSEWAAFWTSPSFARDRRVCVRGYRAALGRTTLEIREHALHRLRGEFSDDALVSVEGPKAGRPPMSMPAERTKPRGARYRLSVSPRGG